MKRFLSILAACLGCAGVSGATSPLATASDYVYAKPAISNAIKGVIMSQSGDYSTMRYEDIAFLREALAERNFLFGGSTNVYLTYLSHPYYAGEYAFNGTESPLSSVRDFSYNGMAKGLSPKSSLLQNPCVVPADSSNAFDIARFNMFPGGLGNLGDNAFTNATVSTVAFSNSAVTVSVTNSVEGVSNYLWRASRYLDLNPRDYCVIPPGCIVYPGTAEISPFFDGGNTTPFSQRDLWSYLVWGPYTQKALTGLYSIVAALKHSLPVYANLDYDKATSVTARYYDYPDMSPYETVSTSSVVGVTYEIQAYHGESVYYRIDHENPSRNTGYDDHYKSSAETSVSESPLEIVTGIPGVTPGGTNTSAFVYQAFGFAYVSCDYLATERSEWSNSGTNANSSVSSRTNATVRAMVPLGELSISSATNHLTFTSTQSLSDICKIAWSVTGLPELKAYKSFPDLPPYPSPGWRWENDTGTSVEQIVNLDANEYFSMILENFYVIYSIAPKSAIP